MVRRVREQPAHLGTNEEVRSEGNSSITLRERTKSTHSAWVPPARGHTGWSKPGLEPRRASCKGANLFPAARLGTQLFLVGDKTTATFCSSKNRFKSLLMELEKVGTLPAVEFAANSLILWLFA